MRFGILGPLEVRDNNGRLLTVGRPQQRALLALLLIHANRVVSTDLLVDCLWGERAPEKARSLLQGCVARLRRVLGEPACAPGAAQQRLVTRPPGYLLVVQPGELDCDLFEKLAAEATAAVGEDSPAALQRAAALLGEALALWRGPVLHDIALDACQGEAARLAERRLAVFEEWVDVELQLGHHAGLIAELQPTARAHPLRERLWGQLMLALHACDRQADALAVYRELRDTLVDQLGVEPSLRLRQIHHAILTVGDPPGGSSTEVTQPSVDPGIPAQLPPAISSFIERPLQLSWLDNLRAGGTRPAGEVPIGVICGTAGVGKTALAVHWAHRVNEHFPDGQLYVNLRGYAPAPPLRPIEALAGFLSALGIPDSQIPIELDRATGLFRSLLTGRRLLVILDNAGDTEQVRPLLPAAPGCLVLVTSRERLGGLIAREGAAGLTLDVLGPEEAHAVIVGVLGADRVAAEPQACADLARLCGMLPLALRIAAANLAWRPGQRIAGYVAELAAGNRLSALAVDGDEQSALRAAFDLSYLALVPDDRRVFRRLGLVAGADFTASAAAVLAEVPAETAGQMLERLAAAHLIDRLDAEPPRDCAADPRIWTRYAFHDLLRLYAAERAEGDDTETERAASIQRLYDWYLYTADAAARLLYPTALRLAIPPAPQATDFDARATALAWLDAERANLIAAVHHAAQHHAAEHHAAEHGPHTTAMLIADCLRGHFWLRAHTVGWLALASAALGIAEARADPRGCAAAHLSLADAHLLQLRFDRAIEHYQQALALSRETGWRHAESTALGNLGNALRSSGRPVAAADHFAEGLAIDREIGWRPGQAAKLGNLGIISRELGRLAPSVEYHTEALHLLREVGSAVGEANALSTLAEACHACGRLGEALEHLTRALAMHRDIGDHGTETHTLRVLAQVHRDLGHDDQARALACTALALARQLGERRMEVPALNVVASIRQRLGDPGGAIKDYGYALLLAREAGIRYAELTALVGIAVALRHIGSGGQALNFAHEALQMACQYGYRGVEGEARTALADIHLSLGNVEQSVLQAELALAIHRDTGGRLSEARASLVLGNALSRGSQAATAARQWRRALALFTDAGAAEADEVRQRCGV